MPTVQEAVLAGPDHGWAAIDEVGRGLEALLGLLLLAEQAYGDQEQGEELAERTNCTRGGEVPDISCLFYYYRIAEAALKLDLIKGS